MSNQLLLWLLSVGGTAHSGKAERKWFVSQLADIDGRHGDYELGGYAREVEAGHMA